VPSSETTGRIGRSGPVPAAAAAREGLWGPPRAVGPLGPAPLSLRVAFGLPGTECLPKETHSSSPGTVTLHHITDLSSSLCAFRYFLEYEPSSVGCLPPSFHLLAVSEALSLKCSSLKLGNRVLALADWEPASCFLTLAGQTLSEATEVVGQIQEKCFWNTLRIPSNSVLRQ